VVYATPCGTAREHVVCRPDTIWMILSLKP
jgi:hypothetical protein